MTDLNIDGTVISGSVAEIVICMAAAEVEGIAVVGGMGQGTAGIKERLAGKAGLAGIELETAEEGGLYIGIHLEVFYGYVLPDVAAQVRSAVADAVETQLGAEVDQVDVFVDGIRFAE
ncbi:MAG: Asp23/Gls24 family envelope stress response protein [Eggerthellaceae bacterium]|nr:Asp23/Gls24 family envelope stress response protein [Eggerthellaceae bacterium]